MPGFDLSRRMTAEALGTALLVVTVVGSGIMAETLTKDVALALLGNTIATGAILVVLITILGPISGAHFNPAVSLVFALKGDLDTRDAVCYIVAQTGGGIVGTITAHLMFALPLISASEHVRTGGAQWFAEWVATFGLVVTILAGIRFAHAAVPWLVGLYITAAYWFAASTSFANPAVAIARSLTSTFSGIRPADLPGFIAAQITGAVCALALVSWLLRAPAGIVTPIEGRGPTMSVTIYHNPACGTSRNTLAIIRATGTEPTIIEYLKTPPTRQGLLDLVKRMGIRLRDILRQKGTPFDELGLDDPTLSDDALLDAIEAHPILINRPIVVTSKGARLCRPSEAVLDLLDAPLPTDYIKEDGERVPPRPA